MQIGGILVSLLALGWFGALQGVPVSPEPLYPTQENFDLGRYMGRWYEVAVVSTCPFYMEHQRNNDVISTLHLKDSGFAINMTGTIPITRLGTCKQISASYSLTNTSGRFFHHVARFGADVDSFVVQTNYDEYAMLILLSIEKPSWVKTIKVKLYSRTMEVQPSVLADFKKLVREQGMSADNIIIKQNKGECVPEESRVQPDVQRLKRSFLPDFDEGSGIASYIPDDECDAPVETGPCFGRIRSYYYNSTSMDCQPFFFGGCLGNGNNFNTESECLQTCRTDAACRLPMETYPCTDQQPQVWGFNFTSGLCLAYKQGFCQANGNKFDTKAKCEEYCGMSQDDGDILAIN